MPIFLVIKLSLAILPAWSGHSAVGVDKLAYLLKIPSLVGIQVQFSDHSRMSCSVDLSMQSAKWHFAFPAKKRFIVCCRPICFQIFPAQVAV
jgi:hypothetical protein